MFKIYLSFVVAVLGIASGAGAPPPLSLADRLIGGYVLWALFWGVPAVWGWFFGAGRGWVRFSGHGFVDGLLRMAFAVLLFVMAAYMFSVLGGGIYCFASRAWRHRHALATTH